ncbi:MAG TPA: Crp/Fnr family transcriptional regulator [Candidatus Acidoferrales bacterium]|jgi:CRP/FNR family transcriptional regulator|nr:Crp/Fnr family transcriptional regulator [Candidatus Acidoferrales bacterium]
MHGEQTPSNGKFQFVTRGRGRGASSTISTRSPYGLQIIENCVACPHKESRLFCNLEPEALQRLSEITSSASYPKGASLFVEGQPARGVFILCSGHVKLSTSSADGRTLILRISEPCELLGLPATISGRPYEVTANVIEPTQANFMSQVDFLNFLKEFGEAALRVAQELSETYQAAFAEIRTIGLSHSAREKLARFLLEWSSNHPSENGTIRFNLALTHEEIAQMIGASRETVTRTFGEFKKNNLLQVKGSSVILKNKQGLESLVQGN